MKPASSAWISADIDMDGSADTSAAAVPRNTDEIELNSESALAVLAEIEALKPARSGYMLFGKVQRPQIAAECATVTGCYLHFCF